MSNILLSFDRIAFYLFGTIPVAWYGLIVTAAIVSAYILFLFLAKKRGIDIDFCLELFIWIVPIAVLFARLGYTLPKKEYFPIESWSDFVRLFDITEGGITIIAAIAGGLVGVFVCCLRTKKYHMAHVCDCVCVALLLGQIIGRWGNFCNQELFGEVITNPNLQWFPFAVFIDQTGQYHNALFFYEGVLNTIGLAIFLVLFFKLKDKIKPMGLTLLYIFWYGLVRSSLEFIKYDPQTFPGTNIGIAQTMCYVAMAIALVLFILLQTGKIHFTTKWFDGLIAKKQKQILDKQLAVEAALKAQNSTTAQDDSSVDGSKTSISNINVDAMSSAQSSTANSPFEGNVNTQNNASTLSSNDSNNDKQQDIANSSSVEIINDTTNIEQNNKDTDKKSFGQKAKQKMSIATQKSKLFFVNIVIQSKKMWKIFIEKCKKTFSKKDNSKDNTTEKDISNQD